MGTVFATVEDYKKRYGEPGDEERCKVLLSDATDQMLSAFEEVYGTYQEGVCAAFDRNAAAVCCLLVNRVLSAPAAMAGATLGKTDLKRLGLNAQVRRVLHPLERGEVE